jgi:integrase
MPSLLPVPGGWRAFVARKGIRESRTFESKVEANAWAARREQEILAGSGPQLDKTITLHTALARFRDEEVPKRGGARGELVRLRCFMRDIPDVRIDQLTAAHLAAWRNARSQLVKPGTIRRDISLLMSVLETARRDWGWLEGNPLTGVKKPPVPRPRTRLITDDERDAMVAALGYVEGLPVETPGQRVAVAFLISLETAMRAGELRQCEVGEKVARLEKTKNGDAREVPLSRRARELFAKVGGRVDVKGATLDARFRQARKSAGLSGFTFHDARATACTRLARKLDVLTLAKIVGHRDPKSLMIYYRESAGDIADRLD